MSDTKIGPPAVEEFLKALHAVEESGDVGPMVALFSQDARIENIAIHVPLTGPEGACEFWSRYRENFGEIRSEFHHILFQDGQASLEWTSRGTSREHNRPIEYRGVSLLSIEEGKIAHFRSYYDAYTLMRQLGVEHTTG